MSLAARLEAHVAELCAIHQVTRDTKASSSGGIAYPRERRIRVPRVRGRSSYYVALHEVGHVVSPGQRVTRLEQEVDAWRWALANALVRPTPGVWAMIASSLGHYRLRGERRVWGTKLPPEGHDFHRLLAEATERAVNVGGRCANVPPSTTREDTP